MLDQDGSDRLLIVCGIRGAYMTELHLLHALLLSEVMIPGGYHETDGENPVPNAPTGWWKILLNCGTGFVPCQEGDISAQGG